MSDLTVSEADDTRISSITDTGDTGSVRRLAACLGEPRWRPTRKQLAWLMARAFRWGREQAWDEAREHFTALNLAAMQAAYATPPFTADGIAHGLRQRERRDEWYEHARTARDDDYRGGPVAAW